MERLSPLHDDRIAYGDSGEIADIHLEHAIRRFDRCDDTGKISRDTSLDMDDSAVPNPGEIERETHTFHPE